MSCSELHLLLDDYLDGQLNADRAAEVERHLTSCVACRNEVEALREVIGRAEALPRELEPARDLWPGIERAIEAGRAAPHRSAWPRRLLLAAAALVLVAFGVVIGRGPARTLRQPTTAGVVTASVDVARAQADYEQARSRLLAALDARSSSLSPATLSVVRKNLDVIDRAVSDIRTALDRDPGNRDLSTLLAAAREQELDLLQEAVHLPARG